MEKFLANMIVKGKVCGFFVVLGYRVLNGRAMVQVKPYNPETGETSAGEIAFDEDALEYVNISGAGPIVTHHGYNSFYGEVVTLLGNGEVIAGGFVIDRVSASNALKLSNVVAGF